MTSHDEGPRTSKPSSPPEDPDNRILRGYCGVKELSSPNPLDTKPKAHAEEEEMTENEQRGSKLPRDIASCPRLAEIVRRKNGIPLKTASQGIPSKKD